MVIRKLFERKIKKLQIELKNIQVNKLLYPEGSFCEAKLNLAEKWWGFKIELLKAFMQD